VPGGGNLASGGGFSGIFARPAYQDGVHGTEATRGVPDVAGDAGTGMALAREAGGGNYELVSAGGTSAATPLWGGLVADADQLAGHDLGFVNPALYQIARSPVYGQAFHDVTTGNNTVVMNGATYTGYPAGPGWDPVTGLGSPDAAVLVPILSRKPSRGAAPASRPAASRA
jgi:subtilase family serine protease